MSNSVPQGWSVSTIGDTCDVLDSKRIPLNSQDRALRQGIYPYYGANGVQGYIDDFIFEGEHVLLAEDGGYFDEWDSRPISYLVTGRFWVNNHAHILKAKRGHETRYVHYSLVHTNILKHINGGTRAKLNQSDMREIAYLTPPLPEQQNIAAILSSVDDVIEKTLAQIDKLKDLKTGMMQELLTKGIGHTEFKDSPVGRIPKAWSLIELGKVLTGIDSGWSPSCGDRSPGTSEWGVLKVSAVTRGEFLESESKTLPEHLAPREKIQVHKGDVLLTRANGVAELVGKCVIVRREPQAKLMMSDKILRLKPTEKLFNEFLLHVFNARSTRKQIELCWGGSSGQKNIGQADIRNFIIPLPSLEEQKIIAKSITQVDHTLYHKNTKLQSLIGSKKALMQDLLTGKVRVKVDQKESAVA